MKITILFSFFLICIYAFEFKKTPTNGRIFLNPTATDISNKKWNLHFELKLDTYFTYTKSLEKSLTKMDPYCEPFCNLTSNSYGHIIRQINHKNELLKNTKSHRSKNSVNELFTRVSDMNSSYENPSKNVNYYINMTDTKFFGYSMEIENELKNLENQIDSINFNFTSALRNAEHILNKTMDLQNYIFKIKSNNMSISIIDLILKNTMDNLLGTFLEEKNVTDLFPFGYGKIDYTQFSDINIHLSDNVLKIIISIPIINGNIEQGFMFRIISLPIKMQQKTYEVITTSEFGIFHSPHFGYKSTYFIPFYEHELLNCKEIIHPQICSLSHLIYRNNSCELALFNDESQEIIIKHCMFREIEKRNYIILLNPYEIYISINSYLNIIEYCPNNIKTELNIVEDGILSINPNCDLISNDFNFQADKWSNISIFNNNDINKLNNNNSTSEKHNERFSLPVLNISNNSDEHLFRNLKVENKTIFLKNVNKNKETINILEVISLILIISSFLVYFHYKFFCIQRHSNSSIIRTESLV